METMGKKIERQKQLNKQRLSLNSRQTQKLFKNFVRVFPDLLQSWVVGHRDDARNVTWKMFGFVQDILSYPSTRYDSNNALESYTRETLLYRHRFQPCICCCFLIAFRGEPWLGAEK